MSKTIASNHRPAFSQGFVARLAESRFLTTSLLIHIALVSILGSVVLFKVARDQSAFSVAQEGSFLQESEQTEELHEQTEEQEFDEPVAVETVELASSPQSTISTLTNTPASWNTQSSVDTMNFGSTLSASRSFSVASLGSAGQPKKMGSLGKSSSFSFMGIRSESRRVAFLLDASGSMILQNKGGGEAYAELKKELVSLVDGLDPATEFNVIMFGNGADLFQPQAVAASDENVAKFKEWLDPYMRDKAGILRPNCTKSHIEKAWGTTRLDVALTAAFEIQAETIFILTDGTPNVGKSADADVVKKWEENKQKNKAVFDKYEKELSEYKTVFKDEFERAKKKADELNSTVSGRTQEFYHWDKFAPNYPKPPPGYYRPTARVEAKDFNVMLKELHQKIYSSSKLPMPSVNIIGYFVSKESEDYLQDITKGIPGKYRTFKK